MIRKMGKKSWDIEETEQVRGHPKEKVNVKDNVIGCGFPLGMSEGEGGRFNGIARCSVQSQERIPPSLSSIAH